MANKEYSMLFKLSAEVGKEFGSTFSQASQQMQQIQQEVNRLNQAQSDISAYTKQQQAVEATKRKLEDLQKQYDNIQKEYEETGESSSALANKMIDKQAAIDKTNQKLEQQTQKLDEMEAELKEAGIDTGNLTAEQEKLSAEMDKAADEMQALTEESDEYGEKGASAFEAVGTALTAAGIAEGLKKIEEAYKECVELSMDFNETLSTVEALSGASAEEMEALSAQAKELGATTKYTANEAAEAMTYMGMAGWDAEQMLSGMDGMLSLAAASGEDLGMVADVVTDNLTAFGMSAEETGRFADVLAATATNSNTSVSVMAETFKKAGPVAGALGYSIEDVSVAIGLMANAGVKGSRAGTALSNTFTGLLSGVTLTGEAIGEVEVSAVQADGSMMSFADTIDTLRGYFEQLTEAERVQNAVNIAGKLGYSGLLAVLNATDEDYQSLTTSINDCSGAAQKMAEIKMDNLSGQMTLLNSATDALKTTIGEAYDNELQGIVKVITQIVSGINDYLNKHPAVLKAIIAITTEVAALVAAYTAYQVAQKAVLAAQLLLNKAMLVNPWTIALAGVAALTVAVIALTEAMKDSGDETLELTAASKEQYEQLQELKAEYDEAVDVYGENSDEAEYLRGRIEDLNAEYEDGKQTISEYAEELNALADELGGNVDAYRNAVAEIDQQETSSMALVHRLEELAGQVSRTAAEEDEMAAIIDKLNEKFPALNLSIEKLSGNQPNFMDTVESLVKQEAEMQRNKATVDSMVESYMALKEAESELPDAEANLKAATEAKELAQDAYDARYGNTEGLLDSLTALLSPERQKMQETKADLEEMQGAYDNINTKLEEAQKAYDAAYDSLDAYHKAHDEAAAAEQAMNETIDATISEVEKLTTAYNTAYEAALDSVSGQYSIWDEANNQIESVGVDSITSALESQAQHWADYQANLDALNAKAANMGETGDAFREMIASFADGSDESVAAIAGMASASEEDLRTMVEKYQEVQTAQEEVSGSLADLTTEFSSRMDELVQNMTDDVEHLNLSEEAAAAGEATINAFVAAAEDSYQRVYDAYAAVASAAKSALGTASSGSVSGEPYAEGTDSATPGVHLVGEEGPELIYFEGGEKVIPAGETADMLRDTASSSDGYGGFNVALTINVTGGDAEGGVRSAGETVLSQVRELMEEYLSERNRSVYR